MKVSIEFRDKTEITVTKIENPQRMSCIINGDDLDALRRIALDNHTTVSEIIRVLVREYVGSMKKKDKK